MKKMLFLLLLIVSPSIFAGSFYNLEFNLNSGNTDNLFNDSSQAKDLYTSLRGDTYLYPLNITEFNIFTEYTNYGKNPNLSNITYGGGFTVLPLSDSSRFTLLLNGNFQKYSYKDALTTNSTEFTDKNTSALIGFGYEIKDNINLRTGFSFSQTGYASEDVSDKEVKELFGGINLSLFGLNTVDLVGGYSFEKYEFIPEYKPIEFLLPTDTVLVVYPLPNDSVAYSNLQRDDLNSLFFSARFSRPLGSKTGFSISYYFREFSDVKDSTLVFGYSTGYLSPWVSSYDGSSIQTKIKTYLIPNSIVTIGFGYWDKNHLRVVERGETVVSTTYSYNRVDIMRKYIITVQIPFVLSSGRFIEPAINLEFTNNNSTVDVYNFDDFTISTGLNFRL